MPVGIPEPAVLVTVAVKSTVLPESTGLALEATVACVANLAPTTCVNAALVLAE